MASNKSLTLWYNKPAQNWETEALPIGNGRIGCMIFGGVPTEHIQFNEISLWTGDENDTGNYQNFGDIYIDLQHSEYSEYRRQLDINNAVQQVTYTSDGIEYKREYFCSAPSQVIVMHFTASKRSAYSGSIRLHDVHTGMISVDMDKISQKGILDNGLKYESQILLTHDGGTLQSEKDRIIFSRVTSFTVYLAARTDYVQDYDRNWRGDDPHDRICTDIRNVSEQRYRILLAEHIKDYRSLFDRVNFKLSRSDNSNVPTDIRLKNYNEGKSDQELESLFFQYGRYLLISSSRPGSLPANLQGLWNNSNTPPWRCDYHSNINIQMNYWPAEVTNLSECHIPFIDYVNSLRKVRTKATKTHFGDVRGWTVQTENNAYGGSSWEWNTTGSAWYSRHLWEHYAYTGDTQYLREKAYPVLKEICEFWEDRLKTLSDGTLVAPDGFSPEQGPREDGVSYDQEIIWDLFSNYIQAADKLGIDIDYRDRIYAMRSRLLVPKIGKWGQLQEWIVDRDDPDNKHRHVSHLYGLYPGYQISPLNTPELTRAAKVSLTARGDSGTGWSKSWKIAFWARLLDGNHAYKMLRSQLTFAGNTEINYMDAGGTYANLFDAHPPFQIDGNFGTTAAIAEMLMQSHAGEIRLLPALPDAWKSGSVVGLCARGGFIVDISWNNGKLSKVKVFSRLGNKCKISYTDKSVEFQTVKEQSYLLNGSLKTK